MITGELKSQIDKVWEAFWTGGGEEIVIQMFNCKFSSRGL